MHVNYDTDFVTFSPTVCMEVGSGSGVCITFLARMIGPSAVYW
jgi:tRNA A58 N-methylase Trm61